MRTISTMSAAKRTQVLSLILLHVNIHKIQYFIGNLKEN